MTAATFDTEITRHGLTADYEPAMRRTVVSRDGVALVHLYRTTSPRSIFDMAYRVTPVVNPTGLGRITVGTLYDAVPEILAVITRHDARIAHEQAAAAEYAAHQEAWYQRYKAANGYTCPSFMDWLLGHVPTEENQDVTA